LGKYFSLPDEDVDSDPLKFWKANEYALPKLAKLAKKYLCIPATSASSERAFSTAGQLYRKNRLRLTGKVAEQILFLHLLLRDD
jgi:hypothetical protein